MAGNAPPQIPGCRDLSLIGERVARSLFAATSERSGRAVTVIAYPPLSEGRTWADFDRAAATAQRLGVHPSMISIHEWGQADDGRPWIVTDPQPADALDTVLKLDGPLEVERALQVGVLLAGALETAHGAGIVHGDLSPARLVLGSHGEPLMTETGLAAFAVFPGLGALNNPVRYHAPPEVLERTEVTTATDVYSLAATVYALIAGRAPHEKPAEVTDSNASLLLRVLQLPVPPVERPGLPPGLLDSLRGPLSPDPGKRPQQAIEVAWLLQDVQRRSGLAITEPVVLDLEDIERQRSRRATGGHRTRGSWPAPPVGEPPAPTLSPAGPWPEAPAVPEPPAAPDLPAAPAVPSAPDVPAVPGLWAPPRLPEPEPDPRPLRQAATFSFPDPPAAEDADHPEPTIPPFDVPDAGPVEPGASGGTDLWPSAPAAPANGAQLWPSSWPGGEQADDLPAWARSPAPPEETDPAPAAAPELALPTWAEPPPPAPDAGAAAGLWSPPGRGEPAPDAGAAGSTTSPAPWDDPPSGTAADPADDLPPWARPAGGPSDTAEPAPPEHAGDLGPPPGLARRARPGTDDPARPGDPRTDAPARHMSRPGEPGTGDPSRDLSRPGEPGTGDPSRHLSRPGEPGTDDPVPWSRPAADQPHLDQPRADERPGSTAGLPAWMQPPPGSADPAPEADGPGWAPGAPATPTGGAPLPQRNGASESPWIRRERPAAFGEPPPWAPPVPDEPGPATDDPAPWARPEQPAATADPWAPPEQPAGSGEPPPWAPPEQPAATTDLPQWGQPQRPAATTDPWAQPTTDQPAPTAPALPRRPRPAAPEPPSWAQPEQPAATTDPAPWTQPQQPAATTDPPPWAPAEQPAAPEPPPWAQHQQPAATTDPALWAQSATDQPAPTAPELPRRPRSATPEPPSWAQPQPPAAAAPPPWAPADQPAASTPAPPPLPRRGRPAGDALRPSPSETPAAADEVPGTREVPPWATPPPAATEPGRDELPPPFWATAAPDTGGPPAPPEAAAPAAGPTSFGGPAPRWAKRAAEPANGNGTTDYGVPRPPELDVLPAWYTDPLPLAGNGNASAAEPLPGAGDELRSLFGAVVGEPPAAPPNPPPPAAAFAADPLASPVERPPLDPRRVQDPSGAGAHEPPAGRAGPPSGPPPGAPFRLPRPSADPLPPPGGPLPAAHYPAARPEPPPAATTRPATPRRVEGADAEAEPAPGAPARPADTAAPGPPALPLIILVGVVLVLIAGVAWLVLTGDDAGMPASERPREGAAAEAPAGLAVTAVPEGAQLTWQGEADGTYVVTVLSSTGQPQVLPPAVGTSALVPTAGAPAGTLRCFTVAEAPATEGGQAGTPSAPACEAGATPEAMIPPA